MKDKETCLFFYLKINKMNIHQAGEFGKIQGNLKYLLRKSEDNFTKETLKETKELIDNLYKNLL